MGGVSRVPLVTILRFMGGALMRFTPHGYRARACILILKLGSWGYQLLDIHPRYRYIVLRIYIYIYIYKVTVTDV
jgi:hypothetical protein